MHLAIMLIEYPEFDNLMVMAHTFVGVDQQAQVQPKNEGQPPPAGSLRDQCLKENLEMLSGLAALP